MARHEPDLQADGAEPLSQDEVVHLLGTVGRQDSAARRQAVACFLAAADGWRDAMQELRGAFAENGAGLRERKAD